MTALRERITSTPSRRIVFTFLALLLAVLFAYPGLGLLFGWSSTEDGGIHRFHTIVWGIHTGLVLSVGYFALLFKPWRRVATAQQLGVAMALMMTVFFGSVVILHFGAPSTGIDRVVFSLLILVCTGVVLGLHPRRRELVRFGGGLSRPMAALSLIGLGLAVPYALEHIQIQIAVDVATDPHSTGGREHWAEMATTSLALPLVGLIAATRSRGWRLAAWTAGLGTMVFGTASIVMPTQASSPGVTWGVVVLVGGILFIAVAEIETRRMIPVNDTSRSQAD